MRNHRVFLDTSYIIALLNPGYPGNYTNTHNTKVIFAEIATNCGTIAKPFREKMTAGMMMNNRIAIIITIFVPIRGKKNV